MEQDGEEDGDGVGGDSDGVVIFGVVFCGGYYYYYECYFCIYKFRYWWRDYVCGIC